jgi:hypothetical protein
LLVRQRASPGRIFPGMCFPRSLLSRLAPLTNLRSGLAILLVLENSVDFSALSANHS